MKVVLFCGGLGTRLREHSDTVPKPLVNIGYRPILWHLMRYYAHYGHREFILCLGYRGDMIRDYFLNYREEMTNDFTLHTGMGRVELHSRDLDDWKVTFVDTGLHSNIGQRLLWVRQLVEREEMFLANYADGLSSIPLDQQVEAFAGTGTIANFASVRSPQSFHLAQSDEQGVVTRLGDSPHQAFWINGGYFVLRPEVFDYIEEGEELVEQPFQRLIERRRLSTFKWDGFWKCMDTYKDKITFDRMEARGDRPWENWHNAGSSPQD
jgi:glucose-1-phosphate cytidylyltransferase